MKDNPKSKGFILFIISLIFAPLAFGTTETWSVFILILIAGTSFLMNAGSKVFKGEPLYKAPGVLFFAAMLILAAIQLIILPEPVLKILSPKAYSLISNFKGETFFNDISRITFNERSTIEYMAKIFFFGSFYLLSIQFLSDNRLLKKTLSIISIFGGILAFSSILQSVFSKDMALWIRYVPYNSFVFGPYVNHNHYAGLMEMIFPIAFGLFLIYRPKFSYENTREKILRMFSGASSHLYILFLGASGIIALSIFASLSRGGIMGFILSLSIFIILSKKYSLENTGRSSASIISILILIGITWFGWERLDSRFGLIQHQLENADITRLTFWKDTAELIKDFLLTGTGIGSFKDIYPAYKSYVSDQSLFHAHNDYLELLAETGIAGFSIVSAFFIFMGIKIFRMIKKRREKYSIVISVASISGILAILFHSIFDFNLRIPANILYFTFLMAVAVSSSHIRFHKNAKTYLEQYSLNSSRLIILVFLAGWIPSLIFMGGKLMGEFYFNSFDSSKPIAEMNDKEIQIYKDSVKKALSYDHDNPDYNMALGNIKMVEKKYDEADSQYISSIKMSPLNSEAIQKYAIARFYGSKKFDASNKLFLTSTHFQPENIDILTAYTAFLLENRMYEKALKWAKKTITMGPQNTEKLISLFILADADFTIIERALPKTSTVWYKYSNFLKKAQFEPEFQIYALEKALKYAKSEEAPCKYVYTALASNLLKIKSKEEALSVMKNGVETYPDDPYILYYTGYLYEQNEISFKAEEFYKKALLKKPSMKSAASRLKRLEEM